MAAMRDKSRTRRRRPQARRHIIASHHTAALPLGAPAGGADDDDGLAASSPAGSSADCDVFGVSLAGSDPGRGMGGFLCWIGGLPGTAAVGGGAGGL